MKKFSWIFALIMALSIGFIGCPSGGDDDGSPEAGVTTVAVTGVTLSETSIELDIDDTETLIASIRPASATNQAVTWSVTPADNSIATVTDNGDGTATVTAVAPGTATIKVTTVDGAHEQTCTVVVNDPTLGTLAGTILLDEYKVKTNTKVTASYSGTEGTPSFQWEKVGDPTALAATAEFTPTEEGIYHVKVTITGFNPKYSENLTVDDTAEALEVINVRFGAAAPYTGIVTTNKVGADIGTVEYLSDHSGYKFTYGAAGYQNAFARFKLELPEGIPLSAYSMVKFKWKADGKTVPPDQLTPEQSDMNGTFQQDVNKDKKLFLLASDTPQGIVPDPDWKDASEIFDLIINTNFFQTNPSEKLWNAPDSKETAVTKSAVGWAPTVNGITEHTVTIPINAILATALEGNVWVAVYAHVEANGGAYTISDVQFIPRDIDNDPQNTTRGPDAPVYVKPLPPGQPFDFFVDLSDWKDVGGALNGNDNCTVVPNSGADNATGGFVAGKLTLPFTLERQRVNIKLTEEQIAAIEGRSRNDVTVEIIASIDSGTANFRYSIGDKVDNGGWNAFSVMPTITGNDTSSKTYKADAVFSSKADDEGRLNYFIIQTMDGNAVTIVIESIHIYTTPYKVTFTPDSEDEVIGVGADVSDVIANGYTVETTAGYGGGFAYFKVSLPNKLSDYKKVKLTYTLTGDDGANKHARVFAFDASDAATPPSALTDGGDNRIGVQTPSYSSGNAGTVNTKTIDIAVEKDSALDIKDVFIAFSFWTDPGVTAEIVDIILY